MKASFDQKYFGEIRFRFGSISFDALKWNKNVSALRKGSIIKSMLQLNFFAVKIWYPS